MNITPWRRASWFALTALFLSFWIAVLGSLPHDARGTVIPSHVNESMAGRETDLRTLQRLLETKIVRQRMEDFGVAPGEALAKLRVMNDRDLHVLASLAGRMPEGGAEGVTIVEIVQVLGVIGIVAAIILVILGIIGIGVLAKYLKDKSEAQQGGTPPAPSAEPSR